MNNTLLALVLLIAGVSFAVFHPRFFRRPISSKTRFWIGLLQLLPLLGLVWLLGDPRAERERVFEKESRTLLLVDDSSSMGFDDGLSGDSRIETVRSWIHEVEGEESSDEKSPVGGVVYLSELVPRGRPGSDFAAAFSEIERRYPRNTLASVLFVSDGRDHSARDVVSVAKQLGIPFQTIGIGPTVEPDSLGARFLEVPDLAQPGSPFLVEWAMDSSFEEIQPAFVSIRFGSREIFAREFELRSGSDHREDWISVTPTEPGVHPLTLEVRAEETSVPPTVARATVTVVDAPPTLLILESSPTKNTRSLTQVALDSGRYRVLRPVPLHSGGVAVWDLFRPQSGLEESENPPWEKERVTRFSPEEWETEMESLLSDVAVVVLGDHPWGGLTESFPPTMERFLAESRVGVLALPGSDKEVGRLPEGGFSDLLAWMSVRRESHVPLELRYPETSKDHPALAPLWSDLERTRQLGPDSYFEETPPVAAILILDARDRALVYSVPFGFGRSTLVAPSNLWSLAAFSDSPADERFLEGLWLGLLDDLSTDKRRNLVTLKVAPETPTTGRPARIQVRDPALRPGAPVAGLQIRRESGEWRNLILAPDPAQRGVGDSIWIPRETGSFEIRYASGESLKRVAVVDRPAEPDDQRLDESFLRSLAESTGGKYYAFRDRAQALEGTQVELRRVVRTEESPLRHDARIGALVAALFCFGWGIRRALSLP